MGRIYPVDSGNQAIGLASGFSSQGAALFGGLNGEFSIVLFDPARSELYLVTDHFGSRPLYYRPVEGAIVFSTDLAALARAGPRPPLDRMGMAEVLIQGRTDGSRTMYEGIRKVGPGSMLRADQQAFEQSIYWDAAVHLSKRQEGLRWETIWQAIAHSTKVRMQAVQPPPYAYLSGGIDTSTVCATLSRLAREQWNCPIVTLSVGGAKRGWDERPFALKASEHIGSTHKSRSIDWNDLRRMLGEMVRVAQEGGDPGGEGYCAAALAAGEGARVVFCGDGGDELFGGYPSWVDWAAADAVFSLVRLGHLGPSSKRFLRLNVWQHVVGVARGPERSRHISRLAKIFIEGFIPGRFLLRELSIALGRTRRVFSDSFLSAEDWRRVDSTLRNEILEAAILGPFNCRRLIGVRSSLPSVFALAWHYHQASSLVPTYPLMDRSVLEPVLASSPAEIFRTARTKDLLRTYLEEKGFPPEITRRTKIGFFLPVASWYANELREFAETLVSNGKLMRDGILRPEAVRALFRKKDSHLTDLVNMEIWYSLNFADDRVKPGGPLSG